MTVLLWRALPHPAFVSLVAGLFWEGVPVLCRVHAVIGMVLIALVPCTRLVHMFGAPVQYLFRPDVVYRGRDPEQLGARPERRGRERAGSQALPLSIIADTTARTDPVGRGRSAPVCGRAGLRRASRPG